MSTSIVTAAFLRLFLFANGNEICQFGVLMLMDQMLTYLIHIFGHSPPSYQNDYRQYDVSNHYDKAEDSESGQAIVVGVSVISKSA